MYDVYSMKFMKVLDPIHKYIYFSQDEKNLIDSLVFQRLREIKQLGFTERTFIGAVHNRLSHSLGSCHLAGLALKNIFKFLPALSQKKKDEFYKLIRVTALLHDIGHGPLSHSSESKMPPVCELNLPSCSASRKANHEDYAVLLVLKDEVSNILTNMGICPQWVTAFFQNTKVNEEDDFFKEKGISYKPLLEQIIHSEIDVDRMDYLKRDSYFCGTYYGFLDFEWILKNLSCYITGGQAFLAVQIPALYTIEDFLLAHHHMRLMVYWHPKNVIYDEMLSRYFQDPKCSFVFPTQAQEYIFFNDPFLYKRLEEDSETIDWAQRIIYNTPYKHLFQIQYTSSGQKQSQERMQTVIQLLDKHSIPFISCNSSSYIAGSFDKKFEHKIYVIDPYSKKAKTLDQSVRVFENRDRLVCMDRIYVDQKDYENSRKLLPHFHS